MFVRGGLVSFLDVVCWLVVGRLGFYSSELEVVIVSASAVNSLERAPRRWLDQLEVDGYKVFHQAETGAVIMDFDKEELRISSYLDPGKELVLQR